MTDKNDSPNNNNKKYTPPTRDKVRNPFDKVLIESLHKPICRYVPSIAFQRLHFCSIYFELYVFLAPVCAKCTKRLTTVRLNGI